MRRDGSKFTLGITLRSDFSMSLVKTITVANEVKVHNKVLRIHAKDNVAVALTNLKGGEQITVSERPVVLLSEIPAKHKFALADIPIGGEIIMYGVLVGKAAQKIRQGELITTQNLKHDAAPVKGRSAHYEWKAPDVSHWRQQTFLGYRRSDGQLGTRNYWLVVPLVFCENRNIAVMKEAFEEELGFGTPQIYREQVAELVRQYREGKIENVGRTRTAQSNGDHHRRVFENIDGIKFLTHQSGCGGTREDATTLAGLLAGYIHHPNVAGATVLSLGCQHTQVSILQEEIRKRDPNFSKPLIILEQQHSGTESAMLAEAIRRTFVGLVKANKVKREPAPLSHLNVALKCGGSDGFSGISANPAIGHTADIVSALGGKAILSEFPELCGVEQELANRCIRDETADRFLQLMRAYSARAEAVGSGFDMNPSPGNIRDGLITDAMKSAGAAKKGGTSPVTDVLDFPEYATNPGLTLLCTPGNDVECVTAQVGSGANVVLFTTGLGTPTGNPIAPVIKISTNTSLAQRMQDIIDIDAGPIIYGKKTVDEMGEAILELIIRVASGEVQTKAESLAQDDFIPWKRGVSL
jgi:altronate hydrolase